MTEFNSGSRISFTWSAWIHLLLEVKVGQMYNPLSNFFPLFLLSYTHAAKLQLSFIRNIFFLKKMSYVYNFVMKRITRSLNILLNKEETKLLKFYFIYIKNWKTDILFSNSGEHHQSTILGNIRKIALWWCSLECENEISVFQFLM